MRDGEKGGLASMAELQAIWVKPVRRAPMGAQRRARLVASRGLEGNANQGGRRQVTVIDAAAWQRAEEELGRRVDPAARRANLMVRGLDLRDSGGRVLRVGPCRILVHGETRPCRRMEKACGGLEAALAADWRGGVYGEVLDGGDIALGDPVAWEPAAVGAASPRQ